MRIRAGLAAAMTLTLATGTLATGTLATGTAAAQQLTVTSWGGAYQDAQRQVFFVPFMVQSGIVLTEEVWHGGMEALRAQVADGEPAWDVVEVRADELVLGCAEGLFEPIDYDAIGGRDRFIASAVHECGVGNVVWSMLMAYDRAVLGAEGPRTWADFWDTGRFPGLRALRYGPQYTLEFALMADGVPPEDVYGLLATEDGVDRAFAKLDELRDHLVWWEDGGRPLELLASGEVVMTSAYNGRIATINRTAGTELRQVWPGSILAVDSWAILRGSPRVEASHRFIAFASDPERQAALPPLIPYGVTSRAARALLDPTVAADLPTAPEHLAVSLKLDTAFWAEHHDALTERFDAWAAE